METKAFPIRAQTEAQPPPSRITSISFRLDRTEPEQLGWDLNHPYVETFWLPTIGPTSTLLLRFVGRNVATETYKLFDPAEIAIRLGLSRGTGRHSPVAKTINRLAYFDLATIDSEPEDTDLQVTVCSNVPELPPPHQTRWPDYLRILHSRAVAHHHIDSVKAASR